ncbi:hypothetical protein EB001_12265 [bacterium]|jgi:hypothetical protein|nr:hypothetical protein [bacterium]
MATEIYKIEKINLVDGTELEIVPLKIKYLREFMTTFDAIRVTKNDQEAILVLSECVRVCMKQYHPSISKTIEDIEENLDLPTVYKILNVAAGIKVDKKSEEPVKDQATNSGPTWETLDLANLESEVFLLGIWKDYDELETSMSMPELMATLSSKRELDYEEKKFLAAIQGVDLDANSKSSDGKQRGQQEWEDLKARVFSGGKARDGNDILALQGPAAEKAGFGIGMGLDYDDLRDPSIMKN